MPYSDNLYSMADDESDAEIEHSPYHSQPHSQALTGQAETPQQWRAHAGAVPGAGGDAHVGRGYSEETRDDDEDVLSPTDGYFHGDNTSSSSYAPTSSNVPHVPNVWVSDPSLHQSSTAESKAREALEESLANSGPSNTFSSGQDPPFSRSATTTSPSSSTAYPTPQSPYASIYAGTTYTPSSRHHPSTPQSGPSSSSGATHSRQSSSAYAPAAPASYRSYTPRRPEYGRRHPSPVPSEAPPAYTPSPTSPVSSDQGRNYSTFSSPTVGSSPAANTDTMGREEAQGLLTGQRPQSMASPDDDYEGYAPIWRERVKRRLPVFSSRTCRNVLIGIVLFLIALGFLSSFFTALQQEKERQGSEDLPVKRPIGGSPPSMDYPIFDGHDDFSWGTDGTCKGVQISRPSQSFSARFRASKGLAIAQNTQDNSHDGRNVHIYGEVILRRSGPGTPDSSITVDVLVNDDRLNVDSGWDSDQQYLLVNVPRGLPWDSSDAGPCMRVRLTVWVPEDGELSSLSIETVHLGVKLLDNLSLRVNGQTKITTTVGPVVAATNGVDDDGLQHRGSPDTFVLDSRFVEVKTTSAPIKGSWPLYDYLGIRSTSGSIMVGIEPKEALASKPKPAILYIKALSGNIEFYEPIEIAKAAFALTQVEDQAVDQTIDRAEKYLPPRDYRVDVQSTSGKIKGSLAFSSTCRLHSTSGSTRVDLLPVLDHSLSDNRGSKVNLETSSTSGTTNITLYEPLWVDSKVAKYIKLTGPPAVPVLPSLPSGQDGLGDGSSPLTPIPVGRVGNGDPYTMLPDVGNSGPSGPVITGAKPATGKREVVTDLNAAANIAAEFEQQAAAKEESTAVAWRTLVSRHSTTSADIILRYPETWEGDIELGTLSGDLKVYGDVHDIKYGDAWPGVRKQIRAGKGPSGGGKVIAQATSGDIKLVVGESDKRFVSANTRGQH